jgi:hypothetical protein
MRLRKIGTYHYKGDHGIYVEAVDVPRDQPRYAVIDDGFLEERESLALDRGDIIDSDILDPDPAVSLHARIDACFS